MSDFDKVEVKDFTLQYDGSYCLEWNDGGKTRSLRVDLDFARILKMLKLEGLSPEDVEPWDKYPDPLKFHKVTLYIFKRNNEYCISEVCEHNSQDIFRVEIKEP